MTSKRSSIEIVIAILEIAESGSRKTMIMYGASLSHQQLKEYLAFLTRRNLLEYEEKERKYYTTDKGKLLLKTYSEIGEMIPLKSRPD